MTSVKGWRGLTLLVTTIMLTIWFGYIAVLADEVTIVKILSFIAVTPILFLSLGILPYILSVSLMQSADWIEDDESPLAGLRTLQNRLRRPVPSSKEEEWAQIPIYNVANYREYLSSEEWNARRTLALTRVEFRCQLCNSEERVEVHHRTYERIGRELPTDLTVLCHACHSTFHSG